MANEAARLAVLTGAGGNVAPAVSRRLAVDGWRLALVTRPGRESEMEQLVSDLHGAAPAGAKPARVYGADLADEDDTQRLFSRLHDELGGVDALFNLAGGFGSDKGHAAAEQLAHMLTVNLTTAVNATRAVLPSMTERGRGFALAVGAKAALTPAGGASAYAAAKAALVAYFRSLTAASGKHGVNMALLFPMGTIDTQSNRTAMPDADRSNWIDPDAFAEAALFLAERQPNGWVHELQLAGS